MSKKVPIRIIREFKSMGVKKDRKSALSAWKNFGSKSIFLSILAGLITAGLFSFVLYAFATYGVDQTFPQEIL